MGELTEALTHHDLVGFDTSIFIYQVEDSPRYATLAEEALSALSDGVFKGVTSVLTLMEVAVRPLQLGREDAANDYELLLSTFPNLLVVDLDRACARRAAHPPWANVALGVRLRANHASALAVTTARSR